MYLDNENSTFPIVCDEDFNPCLTLLGVHFNQFELNVSDFLFYSTVFLICLFSVHAYNVIKLSQGFSQNYAGTNLFYNKIAGVMRFNQFVGFILLIIAQLIGTILIIVICC